MRFRSGLHPDPAGRAHDVPQKRLRKRYLQTGLTRRLNCRAVGACHLCHRPKSGASSQLLWGWLQPDSNPNSKPDTDLNLDLNPNPSLTRILTVAKPRSAFYKVRRPTYKSRTTTWYTEKENEANWLAVEQADDKHDDDDDDDQD